MQELCCEGDLPSVLWVLPQPAPGAPLQRLGASPGRVVLGRDGEGFGQRQSGMCWALVLQVRISDVLDFRLAVAGLKLKPRVL